MLRYVDILYYCTYRSIVGIVGWHIMMKDMEFSWCCIFGGRMEHGM